MVLEINKNQSLKVESVSVFIDYHWKLLTIIAFNWIWNLLFIFNKTHHVNDKPFTKLYLLCFMLLQIECLKFVAFPQLFTILLITKTFDCFYFHFLQSPGQGGTELLSTSTWRLVNHKKERNVFYLRLTLMEMRI